jgi:hypothetical protein
VAKEALAARAVTFSLFSTTRICSRVLIGWRQTLTTSPPGHIQFLPIRAKKSPSEKRALIMTAINLELTYVW